MHFGEIYPNNYRYHCVSNNLKAQESAIPTSPWALHPYPNVLLRVDISHMDYQLAQ